MLNLAIMMGRFVYPLDLKTTDAGTKYVNFCLAVSREKNSNSGEKQTDFVDCIAWNETAEFLCKYFKKGDPAIVTGKIETRSYEDKQGVKKKSVKVSVKNINFCLSKKTENSDPEKNLEDSLDGDLPF